MKRTIMSKNMNIPTYLTKSAKLKNQVDKKENRTKNTKNKQKLYKKNKYYY